MTATDLHQRMLHLLDRAKTMSAGRSPAAHPASAAVSSAAAAPSPSRPVMTDLAPMEPPVDYGPPGERGASAPHPASSEAEPSQIHVPELGPIETDAVLASEGENTSEGAEGRGEQRQKVLRRGKISWQNGNFEIDCQVRDLSATGAKLRLAGNVTTPSCLNLTILPEKITKLVQVCWRDDLTLGVQFIEN